MTEPQESQATDEFRQQPRSLAEWITFTLASVILLGVVGAVVWDWLRGGNQESVPPVLTVQVSGKVRSAQGSYYVPVTVANLGGTTVESVQVSAVLENGPEAETGEQEIDFLSAGETEEGAFVFTQDPRQGKLSLRITSYKLP